MRHKNIALNEIEFKTVPWFSAKHIPTGLVAYGSTPKVAESALKDEVYRRAEFARTLECSKDKKLGM